MKNTSKWIALLLAFVLVLTACGGGTDSSEPASDSAASTEETTESVAESTEESTEESSEESSEEESSTEGEGEESSEVAEGEQIDSQTDANTLVVGTPELSGDYISGFTNSTYDVWIKRLIGNYGGDFGYATYYNDEGGAFIWSDVVLTEEPVRTEEADGGVTYTYTLNDNLVWNDGEPITAKDYVFGQLFVNSPQWAQLGTTNATAGSELLGYEAYSTGESQAHAGLHLIDDLSFSVTIAPEYVPYFYETALVTMSPTPLHRYAPNLDVVETEGGAQLATKEGYEVTDEDKQSLVDNQQQAVDNATQAYEDEKALYEQYEYDMAEYAEIEPKLDAMTQEEIDAAKETGTLEDGTELGDWLDLYAVKQDIAAQQATLDEYQNNPDAMDPTTLLLTASTLDISQNYRFAPDVTAGPYQFVSFENGMATVELNDNYLGNKDGKLPTIERVILQVVNQNLDVDFVISGDIDLTTGVIEGEKIEKAKADENAGYVAYSRNGYGYMPIITDQGATQYKGVRQALAYSLDRNEFVQTVTGGYGTVVDSAYGLAMWELAEEYEGEMVADYLNNNLINYTFNADSGNAALDADSPYTFEADGTTPWDADKAAAEYESNKEGFSYWRYDAEGNQLVVYHEGTIDNTVTDLIQTQVPDNTKLMGLQYVINATDFATLLTHYYNPDASNPEAPTVFNMAVGFAIPNDPYYSYHSSRIGADNNSRVNDPELDVVLETMRKADPTDIETWVNGFVEFLVWYNDYMPAVPLYSNEYYDIFNSRVQGLETSSLWDWSNDIADITLSE